LSSQTRHNSDKFEIELKDDILAIADLRIYKSNKTDRPKYIHFTFEMAHHTAWFETYLPPAEAWSKDESI
jgi:hypothetical protein